MPILTPTRLAAEVEYFADRDQAARDEAADAAYERRERAADQVTFDDVLEQIATMDDWKKLELMSLFFGGSVDRRHFEWKFCAAFTDAFEAATDLRVAQGD